MKCRIFMVCIEILLIISTVGCSVKTTETACTANNLLLEKASFPDDMWQETGSRDLRGAPSRIGIDRAGTSFSTQSQGGAVQHYYRFATETEARNHYRMLQSDWFNLSSEADILTLPKELDNIKLRADEYRLGCSMDVIETCRVVALYRTYIVEFKADMPSLTYNNFTHLLEQIDQRMLDCIGN